MTEDGWYYGGVSGISTHTSLAGRDNDCPHVTTGTHSFLLTRPSRDVTVVTPVLMPAWVISTHTSLAGRDAVMRLSRAMALKISTHTSLAGRDWKSYP